MVRGDDGILLIPESYAVPQDSVAQEYQMPGSQQREVVGRCPFLWGQSLFILGRLLQEVNIKNYHYKSKHLKMLNNIDLCFRDF